MGIITIHGIDPFVDGSTHEQWVRVNDMVTSWLIHSMLPYLAATIMYADSAQAIWTDLQERFSQPNSTKIFEEQKAISNCAQRDLSVSAYYTRLKVLWDELAAYISIPNCSCGAANAVSEILHQDHAMQFLLGLNESYATLRTQI